MVSTSSVIIEFIAQDKATPVADKIAGAFGKIGTALFAVAAAGAAAATAAFISFGKSAVTEAAKVDQLNIVLGVLAKNANLSFDAVLDQTAAVRKMGIEVAVAQSSMAEMIKNNLDWTKSAELARVAQDAAVISMSNSTETFGSIISAITTLDPLMLRNRGIIVDSNTAYKKYAEQIGKTASTLTTAEKQQAFLNAVIEAGVPIAGAYEAAMESGLKIIGSYPRLMNDISVTAGVPFQAAFSRAAKSVYSFLKQLTPAFEEGGAFYPVLLKLAEGAEVLADSLDVLIKSIDIDKLAEFFDSDFDFVSMTQAFEDWVDSIDWKKISQDLAAGIDNIDWAAAGAAVAEGTQNIVDAITIIFEETDWEAVFSSANNAFLDFMAGLTGQGDWENVKATWASNFDQLNVLTNDETIRLNAALGNIKWNSLHIALPAAFGATNILLIGFFADVMSKISKWKTDIESELIKIKEAFKTQFAQMIQAAISTVIGAGARLLAALQELMALLKGAIKPLSITISLPNPEKLASQVDAILAALAPLGGSQGQQVGANNSFGGGSNGGYSAPHAGQSIRATGGNVLAGRPYTVGEQGRELFVPDENGQIVANKNLGGAGGGFVVNLTYSPMFSTVDGYELQERLTPFIERGIRNAQRGAA